MRAEPSFSREEKGKNKKERVIAFQSNLDYTSSMWKEIFRRQS